MDDWDLFKLQEKMEMEETDYDCWEKYVIINT